MKTTILLGSGISLHSGMPSVDVITDTVLNGNDFYRHSNSLYQKQENAGRKCELVEIVKKLLAIIHESVRDYYKINLNYEVLYFIVNELVNEEIREYENPMVKVFSDLLDAKLEKILGKNCKGVDERITSKYDLYDETKNYIGDVAWRMLQVVPRSDECFGIKTIVDLLKLNQMKDTAIVTLNNDNILESVLSENGIVFEDGFGAYVNGVKYWDAKKYTDAGINIYKLHGSIDWFIFKEIAFEGPSRLGISKDWDCEYTKGPNGHMQSLVYRRPVMLTGTFNKMYSYTFQDVYVELYYKFFAALKMSNSLIIAGYGFGDKAINFRIVDWLEKDNKNRIVVINPDETKMLKNARGIISRNWKDWKNSQAFIIEKRIQDTSAQEILEKCKRD